MPTSYKRWQIHASCNELLYYDTFDSSLPNKINNTRLTVTNAPKEQQLESGGDELAEVSWRHQQQPSYAPPISSAADPYSAAGRYILYLILYLYVV